MPEIPAAGPITAETVVYPARLVRTMDPARPTADAVAVRGDRILAVGTLEELAAYRPDRVDDRYADAVLLPGFVEAHSHASSGGSWRDVYVGRFERTAPDGRVWPGCDSVDAVIERLREAEALLEDPDQPLRAWGFDPLFFPGEPFGAAELDRVSTTRPVHLQHASGHICVAGSRLLQLAGITRDTHVEGVVMGPDGEPTGELQEFAAMGLVWAVIGGNLMELSADSLRAFAQDAVNQGATTLTDLGSVSLARPGGERVYLDTATGDFPARISAFHFGSAGASSVRAEEAVARIVALAEESTDLVRFGHVKLMLDGSIQGFTARLLEPGYLGGRPNGIWGMTPEEFEESLTIFHRAGLLVHVHCNGDQATQLFIEVMERVLTAFPRPDHRHTVTHSQMTTPAQYRRMAALGMGANLFANHIWAWGDQHMDVTVGPDRAARMNAARSALDAGVPISLHCDTPVTPLGPLRTVQHAVTRRTPSGRVMGAGERITVEEALKAVTLGGAYLLKMDHEVGSIEPGKLADLAVLADDPCAVAEDEIGAIRVLGTVVGGRHHASRVGTPAAAVAPEPVSVGA
ncbi:amidohydrolase [Isoptericola sp. NPDC019482]|uniref:amidohydrolase n=1 Tax=Isoptericola sp. NPDC019482 TaxID=3154688 RepID=UPI00347E0F4F